MSTTAVYLAGPTASGKSALAQRLAKRLGGEIISVDSMQVYRGLDIGTAKPSSQDQGEVPHHLIDVAEIDAPFDVAQFICLAKRAQEAVRSRGARPIFCGGTGISRPVAKPGPAWPCPLISFVPRGPAPLFQLVF